MVMKESLVQDILRNVHILITAALPVTVTLKIATPFSLHDIPVYEDAPQYYIWLQKVDQFRRHSCLEKNLDTKTHVQT